MSEFPSRVVLKASDRYPVFLEVGVFAFASLALDLLLADPVCSELSNTIASSEDCVLLEEFVSLFIFFILLDFGDASAAAASPNVFSASRYCASETLTQRQTTHDQELVLAHTNLLLLSARSSSHWCTPITSS